MLPWLAVRLSCKLTLVTFYASILISLSFISSLLAFLRVNNSGIPGEGTPQKYSLGDYSAEAITPLPESQQTLTDASIITVGTANGPKTVMKFTKLLKEQGEIDVSTRGNYFIWAHGSDETFGYHAARGVLELNLFGDAEASRIRNRAVPVSAPATTGSPTLLLETPSPTYRGGIFTDSDSEVIESIVWATEATSTSTPPHSTDFSEVIVFDPTDDSTDKNDDGDMTIPTLPANLLAFDSMSLNFDDDGDMSMPLGDDSFGGRFDIDKWPAATIEASGDDNFGGRFDIDMSLPAASTVLLTTKPADTTQPATEDLPMTLISAAAASTTPAIATKPSPNNNCISSMCAVELSSELLLEYSVNVPDTTTVEECDGCEISVKLSYSGTAWIGFGFSTVGAMIGSEAVM